MHISEQIKEAMQDRNVQIARDIANAFATLAEHCDYLPGGLYTEIAERLNDWISNSNWTSDAKLMREVLPIVLGEMIEQEEEEAIEALP
jgi:hypothetical protein